MRYLRTTATAVPGYCPEPRLDPWGDSDVCPDCGADLDVDADGDGYVDVSCSNPWCPHSECLHCGGPLAREYAFPSGAGVLCGRCWEDGQP